MKTTIRLPILVLASAAFAAFLPGATCNTPAAQTAETTIPADVNFAECEAEVIEADAGQPWETVVSDSIDQCSKDVVAIVTQLDTTVVSKVVGGTLTVDAANTTLAQIHAAAKLPAPKLLAPPIKRVSSKKK
jgi:hypothetical protein